MHKQMTGTLTRADLLPVAPEVGTYVKRSGLQNVRPIHPVRPSVYSLFKCSRIYVSYLYRTLTILDQGFWSLNSGYAEILAFKGLKDQMC